ncbi:MAG: hypothetical protein U5O39_19200 [Gammaproteobacteria bacterium]|nr:hypothetical protein [Gammaproteobacteria bacterium]
MPGTILASMPEDAVLFVHGDNYTGLIGYLHYVEQVRPDIELRDWDNLVFPNRLASPYAPVPAQIERNESFLLEQTRPVFATEPRLHRESIMAHFTSSALIAGTAMRFRARSRPGCHCRRPRTTAIWCSQS